MLNNAKEEMSYHGLGKGQFWQTLLLFEGFIIWGGGNGDREKEMFLCVWRSLGASLQRQWWLQMAPFRQKGALGGFLVWKHQTCRDAVGQGPTGRCVQGT